MLMSDVRSQIVRSGWRLGFGWLWNWWSSTLLHRCGCLVQQEGEVTPEVHFQKDLGLDSMDNVELVMALEEEFKLEIPDLEADKIESCKLAIEYIHNHPLAS